MMFGQVTGPRCVGQPRKICNDIVVSTFNVKTLPTPPRISQPGEIRLVPICQSHLAFATMCNLLCYTAVLINIFQHSNSIAWLHADKIYMTDMNAHCMHCTTSCNI